MLLLKQLAVRFRVCTPPCPAHLNLQSADSGAGHGFLFNTSARAFFSYWSNRYGRLTSFVLIEPNFAAAQSIMSYYSLSQLATWNTQFDVTNGRSAELS